MNTLSRSIVRQYNKTGDQTNSTMYLSKPKEKTSLGDKKALVEEKFAYQDKTAIQECNYIVQ